ncbi:MAG: HDIG domain-containing protein [Kiritimatiellae bacterium]|nr:HDIG domain-containing protein [Kiritimatiellia bacterium]
MSAAISKSRTKLSRQRDREDSRQKGRNQPLPLANVLLGIFLWLSVLVLFHGSGFFRYGLLAAGQRAPATVVSTVEFQSPDLVQTDLDRRRAAAEVVPVFSIDYTAHGLAVDALDRLFNRVAQVVGPAAPAAGRSETERAVGDMLSLLGIELAPAEFLRLIPEGREEELLSLLKGALTLAWNRGIVSPEEKQTLFHGISSGEQIMIRRAPDQPPQSVPVADLALPEDAVQAAVDQVIASFPGRHRLSAVALTQLFKPWIMPNLRYNVAETEALRAKARDAVAVVMATVPVGTTLVEAGERITPAILDRLDAHERRLRRLETEPDRLFKIVGEGALLVVALIVCIGLLQLTQPGLLWSNADVLLLVLLSLLTLLPARGLLHLSVTTKLIAPSVLPYLQPLALAPLLGTILISTPAAVVLGLWTSFAAAMLLGHSFMVFTVGLIGTIVAVHAAKGVHRRSRLFRVGLWIGAASLLCAMTFAVLDRQPPAVALAQAGAGFLNGLVCAVLALLLIPLFELLFGITTDITLLELSDMGHPLLQRLAMEAPGTYHHSIMVANLASAAAQEIGANELLVRVCAYYHDIGKLTKPEFFTENVQFRENPHDDLAPSMSTLVITSHVKEGATMAARAKLPRIIIDGIVQHHGTGLVSYFYHRARKQREAEQSTGATRNGAKVSEQDFRYPGPRPTTREMAILSLADAIEAASRSMDKPTPSRIENLVHDIVDGRVEDGQLDECDLTLSQLAAIKRAFIFALTNMLHSRIAYPQDEDRGKQQATKAGTTSAGDPPPPPVAGGSAPGV